MPAHLLAAVDCHKPASTITAIPDRTKASLDKRSLRAWLARLAVLTAFPATLLPADNAHAFHSGAPTPNASHQPHSLTDVVAFVQAHGWAVNLGYVCKHLPVAKAADNCRFRQIAVHARTARLDDHGFNISLDESLPSHILLYHVTPLAGEFFVASMDGNLIAAAFRARGTDFEPMLGEHGRSAFNAELVFWQTNFVKIERDILTSNRNAAPFTEQRQ